MNANLKKKVAFIKTTFLLILFSIAMPARYLQ